MKSIVLNAGSSSIKFQVFEDEDSLISGICEEIGSERSKIKWKFHGNKEEIEIKLENHREALVKVLEILREKNLLENLSKVIHRVLHGGEKFMKTEVVSPEMIVELKKLISLGPLHMPANIGGIELMTELLPNVPQIAVFDTAFHSSIPQEAYLYAVPYSWYKEHGIRKYGFHGSSHQFVTKEAVEVLNKEGSKIITCHLGNGASLCASVSGKCVDTTMGLTPMDGSVMGTRCGTIDPGVLLHMLNVIGVDKKELDTMLNKKSGMLGLSEMTSDMRILEEEMEKNPNAKRAIDVYCYRLVQLIGSFVGVLGGVDAIVFTGGVGENSPVVRKIVLDKFKFLGLELDEEKNNTRGQIEISKENSNVKVLVIPTNEELQMVRNSKLI
jgi:acetate kinase